MVILVVTLNTKNAYKEIKYHFPQELKFVIVLFIVLFNVTTLLNNCFFPMKYTHQFIYISEA